MHLAFELRTSHQSNPHVSRAKVLHLDKAILQAKEGKGRGPRESQ